MGTFLANIRAANKAGASLQLSDSSLYMMCQIVTVLLLLQTESIRSPMVASQNTSSTLTLSKHSLSLTLMSRLSWLSVN